MNKVEKMLKAKKEAINNIKVPDDLEQRLVGALDNKTMMKSRKYGKGKIIAACLVFLILGYNFDTLAFYSKKIIGYSDIMNGTLNQLNELGNGQIIDKGYTLKSGVSVTLDAIMIDESQLLAFYTIEDSKGDVNEINLMPSLKGLIGEYNAQSGQGSLNDAKTSIKWVESFESPKFFEKTLNFNFQLLGDTINEEGKITFDIDRKKAMGHTLKANINKSVKIDKRKIHFDSILASPTRTVINGKIQNILELALDQMNNERIRPKDLELKLIANNEEVQRQGSGMSTDMKGITFHFDYDALPEKLDSLTLELVRFSADHDVNEVINLNKAGIDEKFNVSGQEIIINKIYEKDGNTYINITTDENTVLTNVYLLGDEKNIELNKTIEDKDEKMEDGKILHNRTLEFDGVGEEYKLDIKTMTYSQNYNKTIELPID